MDILDLPVWELLQKQMTWAQLGETENKKILDFGSGLGAMASHYAENNEVVAIEPESNAVENRITENKYLQICGAFNELRKLESSSFDLILCHNVLEYAPERKDILKEFSRLMKSDGLLSVVKHNLSGRVMQMAVLLNNFDTANDLLSGRPGHSEKHGDISYYNDVDLVEWSDGLEIKKVFGQRTFWDLQQNQECQKSPQWQSKMLELEHRVASIDEYRNIAFFHHIILRKTENSQH